jgi:aminoglycoside phosphotransferase
MNLANNNLSLPLELSGIIGKREFEEILIGRSESRVFRIKGLQNETNAYLKINPGHLKKDLNRECSVYQWLKDKLPVPDVYYFGELDEKVFMLISEIDGLEASNREFTDNPKTMVKEIAVGLKMIHDIDISDCPFISNLEEKIKAAKYKVENSLVNEKEFQPENFGKSAEDILKTVIKEKPVKEDLVFTHGDYCLPNIIIKDDKLSGFIDMCPAGIADRYHDLALAFRSLKYNIKSENVEKWLNLFFKEYKLKDIDYSKIEYYILLDELS